MRAANLWASLACILSLAGVASGAVIYKDVAELTAEAQRILIGDVVEVSSFWNDNHDVIKTRVVIDVDDYLLGPGTGIEVLEMRGGTVGDITLQLSVLPVFEQGDHVLLFLGGGSTPILRSFQGAYLTDGNLVARMAPACRRVIDDSLQPLTEMLTQIQQALPPGTTLPQVMPYQGNFVLPVGGPRYALCGRDWTYQANPMGEFYYINPNCADSSAGDANSQIAQIQNGMSAWNNSGADFAFTYGGTSTGTSAGYDNMNLIFFDMNFPGDAVAANHSWSNGGNITETDIAFNDRDYVWWNGSGSCSYKMDIWNVATHELGHSLCLLDLYGDVNSDKTMYGYVSYCDTHARTLHQDDIDGIIAIYGIIDCNGNGIPDPQDIASGTSQDCNGNAVPDECDVAYGTSDDCNGDIVPDECQLTGNDCNANGVPDDCEPDCNSNYVADECDITGGTSDDCNGDIVPDECQIAGNDCNGNSIPDDCEPDCSGNDIPDDCDIAGDPGLDLNVNGIPDSCEADPRLECGVIAVGDSAVTVTLSTTFDSPVVVCSVQYNNNTLPVVTRVSNVTPTSFDVRLQNPSGDPVTADNVSYLVIEEGVSTIDGVEFEAWTYNSTVVDLKLSWTGELQRHRRNHVNPVVLGQVMSENDPDWSVFWCQGATAADPPSPTLLRTGKHVGADLDVTRSPETIGVIVTEAGHSMIGGVEFEARLGDATVQGVDNTPPYPYLFDTAFATAPTVAVVSQAGMIGADGSWAQAYGPTLSTTTTLNLSLDEDQLEDTERRHAAERVAYAVFEAPLAYAPVGNGDFDWDGYVDLGDYVLWGTCLAGPGVPGYGGCHQGDLDGDDDIDLADFALFQEAFTGPPPMAIDTVPVGNPGNANDTHGDGYGGVAYTYNIGKYEVTAGQYSRFLNAVADTDTYDLYNPSMWSDDKGCKIERTGSSGSYTYSVADDWADRPVNYVSWGDAARFANWLHNGQPTGAQDLATTEDGSYYVNGATTDAELTAITRRPDATWVIPSEDEWYKAAYHYNDGVTANYFNYPTASDSTPSNDLIDPDPGNNATFRFYPDDYTIGSPYWRTEVGAHENSDSPYGTFDQGGNVYEWTETVPYGPQRVVRGGSFTGDYISMLASTYGITYPTGEGYTHGFRVAEPLGMAIDTVPVGNAGNTNDTHGDGYGGVAYTYNIGKYEVTAGQYCRFLNAVANTDTYGLYNTNMWSDAFGCKIERTGSSGSYSYCVAPDWEDRPVNYISWGDAARFANWMHNGQPTGAQDLATTEDGSYYLNGAMSDAELLAITREPDATWVIPSEDEWYKAAYHYNDGVTGNYWDYPTGSDTEPSCEVPPGTDMTNGSANYYCSGWVVGSPYYRNEVGAYDAKPSDSPYGTFDQGGNVWEWNEAAIGSSRGVRGASFNDIDNYLSAASRNSVYPGDEHFTIGFRVCEVD